MAKFLGYEDRLEIQNGLKEYLTFTEIGKRLGRDRTTITKEVRNYIHCLQKRLYYTDKRNKSYME